MLSAVNSPILFPLKNADPEAEVQEQALALVRNIVDGSVECIEFILADDALLFHEVVRQLQCASKTEVLVQVKVP